MRIIKKFLLASLVFLFIFLLGNIHTNASSYYYAKRDSILRGSPRNNLKDANVKISIIKGTKVEKISESGDFYKVKIIPDGYYYINQYTGYILKSSLTGNEVKHHKSENRGLSVRDKSAILKNAVTLYKGTDHIKFRYATNHKTGRVEGYNQVMKSVYKSYNKNKLSDCNKNTCYYHLDCSSFVSTVYAATFKINLKNKDGNIFKVMAFLRSASDDKIYDEYKNSSPFYTVQTISRKSGYEKTFTLSNLQTGDLIAGHKSSKNNPNHIMLYVGDDIIIHSTKSDGRDGLVQDSVHRKDGYYIKLGKDKRFNDYAKIIRLKKNYPRLRRVIKASSNERSFNIILRK